MCQVKYPQVPFLGSPQGVFVRHTCFIPRAAHSQLTHLSRVKLFAVFPSRPKKNCAQTEERHMEMTETPTADKGPIFAFGGSHGRMDPGEGRIGPSERPLQSLLQSRACSWGRAGRKSWRVSRAEQSRASAVWGRCTAEQRETSRCQQRTNL